MRMTRRRRSGAPARPHHHPPAVLAAVGAYAAGRAQARAAHRGPVDAIRRQHQREAYATLVAEVAKFENKCSGRTSPPSAPGCDISETVFSPPRRRSPCLRCRSRAPRRTGAPRRSGPPDRTRLEPPLRCRAGTPAHRGPRCLSCDQNVRGAAQRPQGQGKDVRRSRQHLPQRHQRSALGIRAVQGATAAEDGCPWARQGDPERLLHAPLMASLISFRGRSAQSRS